MSLLGGAAIPGLGLIEIVRDAAAELVRLAEIELRIGVAGDRERAPFGDRRLIIARLPRIDAVLAIGKGGRRQHRSQSERKGQPGGGGERRHLIPQCLARNDSGCRPRMLNRPTWPTYRKSVR